MAGHKRHKKDHERTEKKRQARRRDFEQPILGSTSKERAPATSNFTDGEIAGADWKHDDRGRLRHTD